MSRFAVERCFIANCLADSARLMGVSQGSRILQHSKHRRSTIYLFTPFPFVRSNSQRLSASCLEAGCVLRRSPRRFPRIIEVCEACGVGYAQSPQLPHLTLCMCERFGGMYIRYGSNGKISASRECFIPTGHGPA